jgi:surface protein
VTLTNIMKKLFYLFLTVLIVACSGDDGNTDVGDNSGDVDNPCLYNPTLTTSAVTNITETSATLNGVISIVSENCEEPTNTEQGFVYATTIQPTIANTQVNVDGTNISINLEGLTPNTTYYVRTFLTNALGEFYGNEVSFITTEEPVNCDDVVYLADNGITIKACEDANVGDTGVINGVTYTVVDEAMLRDMVANEEDVTKVVTSKVTNMFELFFIAFDTPSDFNQDISSWDVSNVTNMGFMFAEATVFNQDISSWDVSSVTVMVFMFAEAETFNQPIGNWDVSSVTFMALMFADTEAFNQDISNWDVGNVTDMANMFLNSTFNQPIGDWDVSNVTNMYGMFFGASSFNQPIGNWNVSSVTAMGYMFADTDAFNQPIGDWNVSNVTNMRYMFNSADAFNQPIGNWDVSSVTFMALMFGDTDAFNQPIGDWNVSNVTNMRYMFADTDAFNQPIGDWNVSNVTNMDGMFRGASSFNKDLSSWSVDGVTDCYNFSNGATSWTLPQPNFTNCTP